MMFEVGKDEVVVEVIFELRLNQSGADVVCRALDAASTGVGQAAVVYRPHGPNWANWRRA
jgi:hypothetical protein